MILATLTNISTSDYGSYASIAGFVITLVGFAFTLYKIKDSRDVVAKTAVAVNTVRSDLRKLETVSDFASALALMEEIKRLHRGHEIAVLPEKYSALRKALISIKVSNAALTNDDEALIQSAITQTSLNERKMDEAIATNGPGFNAPKVNSILSKQIDNLQEVLIRLRTEIGKQL